MQHIVSHVVINKSDCIWALNQDFLRQLYLMELLDTLLNHVYSPFPLILVD